MLGNLTAVDIVIVIGVLLVSMSIHEATHAYVGLKLGDYTAADKGRISLNPLHHIDPFMTVILPAITLILFQAPILAARPVPIDTSRLKYDEYGMALVAAAGPVSNLLLALIVAIITRIVMPSGIGLDIATIFITLNVSLFVFNLIPIPPLDGSRVLYAFAPEPLQQLMANIEPYGFVIIFGLVLLGGFGTVIGHLDQSILNRLLP